MSRLKVLNSTLPFLALMWVVACCATASADYASAVLADEPIGYWRLNETTTDVAANAGTRGGDLDGTYVDGSQGVPGPDRLTDGTLLPGMGAGNVAFQVGDTDQYVQIADSILSDLKQFTMSGWMKPGLLTTNRIGLFGQNDLIEFGFSDPTTFNIWTANGGAAAYTVPPNTLSQDAWHHVAVVGTGGNLQIYINGSQMASGGNAVPGVYGSANYNFNMGGGGILDATGNQLDGTLDEVAIWRVALEDADIEAMYDAATTAGGNFAQAVLDTDPLGYWRLNEEEGTVAANLGTGGAALDGVYNAGLQGVLGPALPGLGAGNFAYEVGAGDSYVSVPGAPLGAVSEFSMAGFIKYQVTGNRIGFFGQNDTIEFGFVDPDTIQIWTPNGGALNFDFGGDFVEDEWYHIVAVGDGTELRLYIDGEAAAFGGSALAGDPTYGNSTYLFNIGGGGIWDATGNQFTGVLDEVAVWDKALTAAQIQAQFDAALTGDGLLGDYDNSGELDEPDLDLQAIAIVGGQDPPEYDLNGDSKVDFNDRLVWVNSLKNTWIGDANLNGEFNSSDMVQVFVRGKYEKGENASWGDGDWNGDVAFGSGDMVAAFVAGGYEQGLRPAAAVSAVPEPGSIVLALLGAVGLVGLARRRHD